MSSHRGEAERSRAARMTKTQRQGTDDAAPEGPPRGRSPRVLLRQPGPRSCPLHPAGNAPRASGPCPRKHPTQGQSSHELGGGWAAAGPQRRLHRGLCDDYTERPHWIEICSESLRRTESLQALGGKLQDWRATESHRKIPVRARSRHKRREAGNGSLDGREDRSGQSSAGWYGKEMEKWWNKCLESPSGVAGREQGNCDQMFALPPCTPFARQTEKFPRPVRSESMSGPSSKRQDGRVCQTLCAPL